MLTAVERGEGFAADLLRAQDPPFVRELVLGVLRRRLTLDTIHDAFGKRPIAELDEPIRHAVRLGLHQLVFLDGVPAHAAVGETVGAVRLASHRAYVNGLLRGVQREMRRVTPDRDRGGASPRKRFERAGRAVFFFSKPVFCDPERNLARYLAEIHSHPEFLVQAWLDTVGETDCVARLEAGNRTPPLIVRPRRGRASAAELVEALAAEGVPAGLFAREAGEPAVQIAGPARALFASRTWRAGRCSVQDPRQMDAVELLDPQPGERIWDACAAPGGKTAQIAECLRGQGELLATDVSEGRLERVREGLERLGLSAGVTLSSHDLTSGVPPSGAPAEGFHAILLDAPCSNSAVLDRRPEARWRLSAEHITQLAVEQSRLIEAARAQLAPGGRLVYAVCSHEPEEGSAHGLATTRSPFVFTERRA
ncbi:MAG: ribosomal RNA small subunit methyltransferase B [Planctomycetota bacterium]|nr:MAG: ribosomal RNA small subunit methyltransferase B [Planctomycetota bacterium]